MSDAAENENAHGKRQAMQNWELFPCYLPSSLWENFQKAANMVSALDILLVWLLQLGMRTPSEPTQAMLTALLILRENDERKPRGADALRSLFCAFAFEQ